MQEFKIICVFVLFAIALSYGLVLVNDWALQNTCNYCSANPDVMWCR